jgi:hypothetical protein
MHSYHLAAQVPAAAIDITRCERTPRNRPTAGTAALTRGCHLCRFQALLRLLGLIFLIAFASYWVQLPGLYGEDGIEPASAFLLKTERWMGAR